jgi:hypothetical protein
MIVVTTGRRLPAGEKKQLLAGLEVRAQRAERRGLLRTAKGWREAVKNIEKGQNALGAAL